MKDQKSQRIIYEGVKLPQKQRDKTKDFIMEIEADIDSESELQSEDSNPFMKKKEEIDPLIHQITR